MDTQSPDHDRLAISKDAYKRIAALLAGEYGYPAWRQSLPPVEEMVNTILSQNTSDTNRDKAYDMLRARFPTWEAVRDAPPEQVIEAVRAAGLANQKGPRIQAALQYLTETQGAITLDFLKEMDVEEARAWLTAIDGIGPKTAAIILLFSLNKPAFPVDTHVHRVSQRLGLIDKKTGREKAHEVLAEIVDPVDYYPFHLQLIWHGRKVCEARNPKCGVCVLQEECAYFRFRPPSAAL